MASVYQRTSTMHVVDFPSATTRMYAHLPRGIYINAVAVRRCCCSRGRVKPGVKMMQVAASGSLCQTNLPPFPRCAYLTSAGGRYCCCKRWGDGTHTRSIDKISQQPRGCEESTPGTSIREGLQEMFQNHVFGVGTILIFVVEQ